jgi:hypothetical protein
MVENSSLNMLVLQITVTLPIIVKRNILRSVEERQPRHLVKQVSDIESAALEVYTRKRAIPPESRVTFEAKLFLVNFADKTFTELTLPEVKIG